MDNSMNDGGPAFPVPEQHGQQRGQDGLWEQGWEAAHTGMSLSQWFAGQALQGMVAALGNRILEECADDAQEAKTAYKSLCVISMKIGDMMVKICQDKHEQSSN